MPSRPADVEQMANFNHKEHICLGKVVHQIESGKLLFMLPLTNFTAKCELVSFLTQENYFS